VTELGEGKAVSRVPKLSTGQYDSSYKDEFHNTYESKFEQIPGSKEHDSERYSDY